MFTVGQVRETLENNNAKDIILSLQLEKKWYSNRGEDYLAFDLCEHTPFYSDVYNHISHILEVFRMQPQGFITRWNGLSVSQIGKVLNDIGEPWPDIVIAIAIQYQLLKIDNKLYSLDSIMQSKFYNLDVKQNELLFHCQKIM